MKRRKRRRARKSHTNPRRKRRVHAKRRHARKNPRRRRRHAIARVRRASRRNPRRRHRRRGRRHVVRRHMSNPRRRRRHRRNPSLPKWAIGALAVALAAAGYAVVNAGSYALTQRIDPSLDTAVRNRYIASALCVAGGVLLAFKSPILGIGLAAGGAIAAVGSKVTALLSSVVDSGGNDAARMGGMGAVYGELGGYVPDLGAVYGNNMAGYVPDLGAVYGNNMAGIGAYVPPAPWSSANPFG